MDKQNRDRQRPSNPPRSGEPQQRPHEPEPGKRHEEQIQGGGSDQPQKTPGVQRQPGRMPLPD